MAKEWVLNMATNRWGLNKKRRVGPVSAWIREVAPRSLQEWETAYYARLEQMLAEQGIHQSPQAYLRELGERLFVKITEVLRAEVEDITLEECVAYIRNLVLQRTFEGYQREIETIYGQLRQLLGVPIEPAPDDIDRRYQVDFLIPVGPYQIGVQIKPLSYEHAPEIHAWRQRMAKLHRSFTRRFGGRVFIVFSRREGRRKIIANPEVIAAIQAEIHHLRQRAEEGG